MNLARPRHPRKSPLLSTISRFRRIGKCHESHKRVFAVESLEDRDLLTAVPVGPELLVYTDVEDTGSSTYVASSNDGDFVVAWTNGTAILARRYSDTGASLGDTIQVTEGSYNNSTPVVGVSNDGDFVVAWRNGQSNGDIYARRYYSNGTVASNQFRVNSTTLNDQSSPAIAMAANGSFIITWESYQNGQSNDIYGKRYDTNGVSLGGDFLVNSVTQYNQEHSSVAVDASGNFIVSWSNTYYHDVFARRFFSNGTATGPEFQVNAFVIGTQEMASVAASDSGEFVIAWESDAQGDESGIFARRFSSTGTALGSEFRVDTRSDYRSSAPAVGMSSVGDFVVTWVTKLTENGSGIFGRQFDSEGNSNDGQYQISASEFQFLDSPGIAMAGDGDYVVTWLRDAVLDNDLYAQLFASPTLESPRVVSVSPVESQQRIADGTSVGTAISSVLVYFSEEMATTGTGSVTNLSNWQLIKDSIDVSSAITGVNYAYYSTTGRFEAILSLAAVLPRGSYILRARETMTGISGLMLDGDGNASPGGDFILPL